MASGRALQRCKEFDVFRRFYASLNSSISDPDVFAANLISEGFVSRAVAANKMPLGISNYQKVGNLLGVADAHIKSAGVVSYDRVRERFKAFLSVLSSPELGLDPSIPTQMEEQCCTFVEVQCYGNLATSY